MFKYQNRSYNEFESWKKFQPFFPEMYRLNEENLPDERYIKLGKFNIHIDDYSLETKSKVRVMLLHGGGGNGRLFSPVGIGLKNKGIESFAPDLPGFGLTEYSGIADYHDWIDLVSDIIDYEYSRDPRPIYIFGMSLGGMLAYQAACKNKHVAGIIVTALADTTKDDVQMMLSKDYLSGKFGLTALTAFKGIADGIKVPIKMTTKMWAMANNQEFVSLLKNDEVGSGSWVHLKFLRTLMTTKPILPANKFQQCPVLFLQPQDDMIMPFELSKEFFDNLKVQKELIELKNCGHIPLEEPGIHQLGDELYKFITK